MKTVFAALLGGIGYPMLEILYRGRTHKSMALAGALALPYLRGCACLPLSRPLRALAGAVGITTMEAIIGIRCNRDHRIWDYRNDFGNWHGQVCVKYGMLWYALAFLLVFRPGKAVAEKMKKSEKKG